MIRSVAGKAARGHQLVNLLSTDVGSARDHLRGGRSERCCVGHNIQPCVREPLSVVR